MSKIRKFSLQSGLELMTTLMIDAKFLPTEPQLPIECCFCATNQACGRQEACFLSDLDQIEFMNSTQW